MANVPVQLNMDEIANSYPRRPACYCSYCNDDYSDDDINTQVYDDSDDDWRCQTGIPEYCYCEEDMFCDDGFSSLVSDDKDPQNPQDHQDPRDQPDKSVRESQVDQTQRIHKRQREQAPQPGRQGLRRAAKRVKKLMRRLHRTQTKNDAIVA